MRSEVASDLTWSSRAFESVVWPHCAAWCRGGRLVSVEGKGAGADYLSRSFDAIAGIDAWQVIEADGLVRGIASRVQRGKAWRTFTIRYSRASGAETEWPKRLHAIDHPEEGALLPALTVQAYISEEDGSLICAAMVRTSDLFGFARSHEDAALDGADGPVWIRSAPDGNRFLVVPWAALQEHGVRISIYEGSDES